MSGSLDLCGSPRCTAPTTAGIHVAGGSSVLQLPASAGCQHAVPSLGEIRTILSGSWLMVCTSTPSTPRSELTSRNSSTPGRRPSLAPNHARFSKSPPVGLPPALPPGCPPPDLTRSTSSWRQAGTGEAHPPTMRTSHL